MSTTEFVKALTECLHKTGQLTHLVYFADKSWHISTGSDEVIAQGIGLHDLGYWISDQLGPDSASGGAA